MSIIRSILKTIPHLLVINMFTYLIIHALQIEHGWGWAVDTFRALWLQERLCCCSRVHLVPYCTRGTVGSHHIVCRNCYWNWKQIFARWTLCTWTWHFPNFSSFRARSRRFSRFPSRLRLYICLLWLLGLRNDSLIAGYSLHIKAFACTFHLSWMSKTWPRRYLKRGVKVI